MTYTQIIRNSSLTTSNNNLEHLYSLKKFPVFIGATNAPHTSDIKLNMDWDICTDSGCIQLREPVDPKLIYSSYHSEALGETWRRHHNEFVNFVEKFVKSKVLEVGGSNGHIANMLLKKHNEIEYTIVEPNPICKSNDKLTVLDDFFDHNFASDRACQYDLVLHSHTLEHAYDPIGFIKGISVCTMEGGYQVLSIPNLKRYMEKFYTNCLNFEHTYFLTQDLLISMMSAYNFVLIESKEFEEHSLFFTFQKSSGTKAIPIPDNYREHKLLFKNYIKHHISEVERLNKIISNCNNQIFLFGAHVFSQYLINLGLKTDKISYIIDNSINKEGKRLYGTDIYIKLPNAIKNIESPIVILKAGQYQEEVKKQLMTINKSTFIIE